MAKLDDPTIHVADFERGKDFLHHLIRIILKLYLGLFIWMESTQIVCMLIHVTSQLKRVSGKKKFQIQDCFLDML